ncbi:MAG TPA: phosphoribosyltransferase [Oscillatoriales cyanobacterium M4454_W2019_049]|nr:phosphoribosyltransferase [Oscillatoriales cyanobacterium M4454_W2019_049]
MNSPHLDISWSDYHQTIERLAAEIHRSQWQFDRILCLARGGLRVGDLLSRIYDKPLAILAVSSYGGETGQVRGTLRFAEHITSTHPLQGRVLLVDDLVDSGLSLQETLKWLEARYGSEIDEVRTAVLWYKARSIFTPDYYVEYLADNPWIHQPFSRYEQLRMGNR